jgi:hypothetical protein
MGPTIAPEPRGALGRVACAAIIGSAITSLPWLVSKADVDWLWGVDLLLMPGMVVGLAISRNVHTYSLPVVLVASGVSYSWLAYLLLRRPLGVQYEGWQITKALTGAHSSGARR